MPYRKNECSSRQESPCLRYIRDWELGGGGSGSCGSSGGSSSGRSSGDSRSSGSSGSRNSSRSRRSSGRGGFGGSGCSRLGGRGSGGSSGSSRDNLLLTIDASALASGSVDIVISLIGAVDGNLDSDLATLDLLSVHLRNSLLLELLRGKSDEAEATSLASLTPSLKLLDHKSRNRSEGNLSGGRLVSLEKLNELLLYVSKIGKNQMKARN